MAAVGLNARSDDELIGEIGPPLTVMLANVGVAPERIDEARDLYRIRYHAVGVYECELYPGIVTLLEELRTAGWQLATATSKGSVATELMIDHFELRRYFDVVASASMDSSSHSKVDVIRRALAGLAPNPDSTPVMIGDRHYDIDGARDQGLTSVGVLWGYGSRPELESAGADHIVADIDELRTVLTTQL